jgi:hypothetical protein
MTAAQLEGFDQLQAKLKRMGDPDRVMAALRPNVTRVAAKRLARAKQLAPRMDGILVNSAYMEVAVTGMSISVDLGFSAPYAEVVHENPRSGRTGGIGPRGQRYRKWAHVGQWRYLRTAMEEGRGTDVDEIARGVNAWLRQQAS